MNIQHERMHTRTKSHLGLRATTNFHKILYMHDEIMSKQKLIYTVACNIDRQ